MKKNMKKAVAWLMVFVMLLGIQMPQKVEAANTYQGAYNIASILTNFQYYTEGNCTTVIHTVGSVAVGGSLNTKAGETITTIGDGARTPSYANLIVAAQVGDGTGGDYQGTDAGKILYYGSLAEGAKLQDFRMIQNAGYMDISGKFANIRTESLGLVSTDRQVAQNDIIVCDFTNGTKCTIDYTEFKKAKEIHLLLNDITQVQKQQCVINIVGVNDEKIILDGTRDMGAVDTNKVTVKYKTSANGTATKLDFMNTLTDGRCAGGQSNFTGMNLIFNFPDATGDIMMINMGGHTVAPNARVIPSGGTLEGGVIAKEVWMSTEKDPVTGVDRNAEGHFYPYEALGGTPVTVQDVQLIKRYVDPEGNELIPPTNAKFQLLDILDSNKPVGEPVEVIRDSNGVYRAVISGSDLKVSRIYKLEETVPQGFKIPQDASYKYYRCYVKVLADGSLEYAAGYANYEGELTFSKEIPVIPNVGPSVDDIQLTKTFVNSDGSAVAPAQMPTTNAIFTLYSDEACTNAVAGFESVEAVLQTDGSYKVIIDSNKLTLGSTYYLSETTAPTNYKKNSTVYACTVGIDGKITYKADGTTVAAPVCKNERKNGVVYSDIFIAKTYVDFDESALTTEEMPTTNAKFSMYSDAACRNVIRGYESIEAKLSGNYYMPGYYVTISKDELDINTTYYLKEVEAPEGFELNSAVYACKVESNGYITYSVDDTPLAWGTYFPTCINKKIETGDLNIFVKDEDGNGVGGIEVIITGPDEKEIKVSTDPDGKVNKTDLPKGDYSVIVNEQELPTKYTVEDNTKQTDNVDSENTGYYEFVLIEKPTELKVTVIDAVSKVELSGATVVIIDSADTQVRDYTTNDTNNPNTDKTLPEGTYTVKVTTVPSGYEESTEEKEVTLIKGEPQAVVIELERQAQKGSLEVIVHEKDKPTNPMVGVSVTITGPDNYNKTFETTNEGKVNVSNLPVGDYKVVVDGTTVPTEYQVYGSNNDTKEVEANTTTKYTFLVEKKPVQEEKGSLTVIVTDEKTQNGVGGIEVVITGPNGYNETVETGSNGSVEVKDLTLGTYTVVVNEQKVPTKYEVVDNTPQTSTVEATSAPVYEFVLKEKPGSLTVTVVDAADNQTKVPGATVTITDKAGNPVKEYVTDGSNNPITVGSLTPGDYVVKITKTPDGYKESTETKTVTVPAGENKAVVLPLTQVEKGSLSVIVIDERTQSAVAGATAVVKNANQKVVTTVTSKAEGPVVVNNLPIGDYTVTITKVPNDYTLTTTDELTQKVKANLTTPYEYKVNKLGSLTITVKDDNGTVIQGAEVVITKPDGTTERVTTDSNGVVKVDKLPEGEYKVTIDKIPDGYTVSSDKEFTKDVVAKKDTAYDFEIATQDPVGHLSILVTDERTKAKVPNAKLSITGPNNYKKTVTTDTNGACTVNGLKEGKYTVTVTSVPDGYTVTTDKAYEKDVVAGQVTPYEYKVDKLGSLEIVVIDERTKKEVPGATLVIKTEAGQKVADKVTDEKGMATATQLPTGKYVVTITEVPAGYAVTTDKVIIKEVVANLTTKYEYRVDKIGNLSVLVTDERTQAVVPGAKVEVKDKNGNFVTNLTTDKTGTATAKDLFIGKYTVTVTEVPDGYTVTTKKELTQEVKASETTKYEYKVDKLGSLSIIVTDERTHAVVPGAKVEIKDSTGKTVATGKTDAAGLVKVDGLPTGEYKVVITEVPKGYTVTTNKEVTKTVEANKTTDYEFKVDKLGGLQITVKDDNGTVIQGAEVIITKPDGTKETVTTDSNGVVKVEKLPEGEYTVTINKIPDGYTVSSDKEYKKDVVANKDTAYDFKIETKEEVGHLSIVVTDERTKAKVPGAKVSITGPNNYKNAIVTDANGSAMVNGLKVGKYTVTVTSVPDGYTVTTDKSYEKDVVANKVTPYEYKVDKLGGLQITVIDEDTKAVVPGAVVVIKDAAGKTVATGTTDVKGMVSKEKLPVGKYTVTITSVPNGYTVTTDKEFVKDVVANDTTKYEFKVDKHVTNNNTTNNNTTNNNTTNNNTTNNTTINNNTTVVNPPAPEVLGDAKAPKTGDNDAMRMMMIFMMLFAGVGVVSVAEHKRRTNK